MGEYVDRPTPLPGYRELTQDEKDLVDQIKAAEVAVAELWAEARIFGGADQRHSDVACTRFEEGFMWLIRSITRPKDVYGEAVVQNAAEGRY